MPYIFNRRFFALAAILIAFATASFANPGGSDGGNGPGDRNRTSYTEIGFLSLNDRQLDELYDLWERGASVSIRGFSGPMSAWLLQAAASDRRYIFRLMREMSAIEPVRDRANRLRSARDELRRQAAALERSIRVLERHSASQQLSEERARLTRTRTTLETVETWLKFPHEGTN
ncbi:hypothetical protein ATO6_00965 [Oceanicola sp. 22II-s10i]|uniref:hypothetical protein n=1 Tax=Oceanicola sp. 22II-s10i TaxID=1317116 RepID=UPI000B529417|nr:hypothetical protein [Oceanicola sp. 22II-s10i]OWU85544.1 hypothetical protein ATO6_00965 [Oceanicola sp. 22II-s10i]